MCFVVVVSVSTQGEVHFDICGSTWGYLLNFHLYTQKHPMCKIGFYQRMNGGKVTFSVF